MNKNLYVMAAAMVMLSCNVNKGNEAQKILDDAQGQFDKGNYAKTLVMIDSLRRSHPEAIEERKKALKLFQDASEQLAQQQIVKTDSLLQLTVGRISVMKSIVEEHKRTGSAMANELEELTRLQIRKDSLQARFDTQCATVRLIREKRKANNE